MSSSLRVKTATSPPSRWTWTRIAVELPLDRRRAELLHRGGDVRRGRGEHRPHRPADLEPEAASASAPPASAAAATAPRSPRSISARRRAAAGTLGGARGGVGHHALERALAQLAGEQRAQEAPARRSVARPNSAASARARAACEPGPRARRSRRSAASTSPTVSDGSAAGGGSSRSAAQPTPIWRWRSSPDRYATAMAASSGEAARSASASELDLAAARAGGGDGLGRGDEVGEQHADIVPYSRLHTVFACARRAAGRCRSSAAS